MKVSEITEAVVAGHLRLEAGEYTEGSLIPYLTAAIAYAKDFTGLDATAIDLHEDITIAVLVLCQDLYDNRSMYVDKSNVNKVVETILGMHSVNLLPTSPDGEEAVTS